jgi:hypothetical protein
MSRRLAALIALLTLLPAIAQPACTVSSGPQTTALIELYTSEGCSSCPPADALLGKLPTDSGQAVPIALHVSYWDYIGWKDSFAQPAFADRQRWQAQKNRGAGVYTPQVFVAGSELADWDGSLHSAIRSINAEPARASITLRSSGAGPHVLSLNASVSAPAKGNIAVFLAVTEDSLNTPVRAGENAGRKLHHEHVVRQWLGPIGIAAGQLTVQKNIPLQAGWNPQQLDVVGFVQDMDSGEVLQAVGERVCLDR